MDIYDYTTRGGKNVITNYIDKSVTNAYNVCDCRYEWSRFSTYM